MGDRFARACLFCSMFLLAGCGGDDAAAGSGGSTSSGGGSGGSGGAAGAGGASGTGGGVVATCSGGSLAPGDSTVTLTVGGVEREARLHVPPSYDGATPVPLVLNFHGYTSNMGEQQLFSAMNPKSDSAGFLLVYPNGLKNPDGSTSWNAGACCAFGDAGRDDVAFVSALIDDLASKGCIDLKRVYSTGMSNGGFFSHYLGCKLADRIAAIAPVAGVLGIPPEECKPSRPVPIVDFHGTGDPVVPYDGGGTVGTFASVASTFQAWAALDGCTGAPKQSFVNGKAHCDTYDTCKDGAEVTLCTIDDEGHCWPGQALCPSPLSADGKGSTDISANDRMWELFQKFSL
jgi:polyhydroxybutyrate depolymerase